MRRLSHSLEHYLKTVYELDVDGRGASVSDIAAALHVSRASACNALHELERKGLVTRTLARRACLSLQGMALAVEIETGYLASVRYFMDILGFTKEKAEQAACALEHVLADGEWQLLDEALPALP